MLHRGSHDPVPYILYIGSHDPVPFQHDTYVVHVYALFFCENLLTDSVYDILAQFQYRW